jgi:hypothetical protein
MSGLGERLEAFWWGRVPRALSRLSPVAAAAAFDGAYLVGWRLAGALVPLAAVALGLGLGWLHPPDGGYTFTSSLLLTAVLLGIGGIGSGVGLWLAVGFAIGDFILFPHLADGAVALRCQVSRCTVIDELLKVRVPLLISYVLLAQGTVLVPFASTAVRSAGMRLVARFTTPGLAVGVALQAVVQAALSLLWAMSLAFGLRPLWTFLGDQPPVDEVQPVQDAVVILALVGGMVGALRVGAEYAAVRQPAAAVRFEALAAAAIGAAKRARLPFPVGIVVVALLTTAVAAGLVESWLAAGVLFAALVGIGLVRARLTRVVPFSGTLVRRVPLFVRLAIGGVVAFLVARQLLTMASQSDLVSSLASFLATLLIFAIVAPEPAPEPPSAQPSGPAADAPTVGVSTR